MKVTENALQAFGGDGTTKFWIGITQLLGNQWTNIDDGSSANFFDWGSGEPSNSTNQVGCVSVDTSGYWYDDNCFKDLSYACEIPEEGSTTPVPSSVTTTTAPKTTTNNPNSYTPCESSVLFVQDLSSSIGNDFLSSTLDLTSKFIVEDSWTHYERIGLASYALNSSRVFGYGSFYSRSDFTTAIQSLTQFTAINSIASGMTTIERYFQNFTVPENTVFYTSKADPSDVQNAIYSAMRIAMNGKLIIVGILPAANAEALQPLSNVNTKIITFSPTDGISYNEIANRIRNEFVCNTIPTTPPRMA